MFCPSCNTQNDAMAIRCFQCHTQLILPEQDRAPEVKALVRGMNSRLYGAVGFVAFCVIGMLIFQNAVIASVMGIIGGALGRYIASQEDKGI